MTFCDASSVDKVLGHGSHDLDGKKIDPKVAFPRRAHPKVIQLSKACFGLKQCAKASHEADALPIFLSQMVTRTKKIFVGGLSAPSTLEDVKNYFEQFGKVRTSPILVNKTLAGSQGGGRGEIEADPKYKFASRSIETGIFARRWEGATARPPTIAISPWALGRTKTPTVLQNDDRSILAEWSVCKMVGLQNGRHTDGRTSGTRRIRPRSRPSYF